MTARHRPAGRSGLDLPHPGRQRRNHRPDRRRRRHRPLHPADPDHGARRTADAPGVRLRHLRPDLRPRRRGHRRADRRGGAGRARAVGAADRRRPGRGLGRRHRLRPALHRHPATRSCATNSPRNLVFPFYTLPGEPGAARTRGRRDRRARALPGRPAVPGTGGRGQALRAGARPGVDRPQRLRSRHHAHRGVRGPRRPALVPDQPGSRRGQGPAAAAGRAGADAAGQRPRPAHLHPDRPPAAGSGITVPAGTAVSTSPAYPGPVITFRTAHDLVIPEGTAAGDVEAVNVVTVDEVLGVSAGEPGQRFTPGGTPFLAANPDGTPARRPDGHGESTRTGPGSPGRQVATFADVDESDSCFLWDAVARQVAFGPRTPYAAGGRHHGAVPVRGAPHPGALRHQPGLARQPPRPHARRLGTLAPPSR